MSRGSSRVGRDSAGGTIVSPGAPTVFVENSKASLHGDSVASHGKSPHTGPTMVASINTVRITNKRPIVQGDNATCGHTATGSSTVFFGDNAG